MEGDVSTIIAMIMMMIMAKMAMTMMAKIRMMMRIAALH